MHLNTSASGLFKFGKPGIMTKPKPNRLIHESSPYLQQHAHNPVDWYPYGNEAFDLARQTNRPVLVSIGYSACHWCHVMEHESFSNSEVAEIMNRDFVCVKVDREERPDVDQVFMSAVQLLHNSGGWPLNCFALPDGRPFWGGTYFRPAQWLELLAQISEIYQRSFQELENQAMRLASGIAGMSVIEPPADQTLPDTAFADEMYDQLSLRFDNEYGGTLGAPKFPMPVVWNFVAGYYHTKGLPEAINQLTLTLRKMAMGGIFDQIGGGFARYSTDKFWKVPHFEKMLYDNAQLVSLYARAFSLTGEPLFRETMEKTLAFVSREFTSPEGWFYSALDADSEGEEGRFYLWDRAEILKIMPEYGDLVSDYFGIGKEGVWENGKSIPVRPLTDSVFASRQHLSSEELKQLIKMASSILLEVRNSRIKPGLDNKLIVSWNALMISALADSFSVSCNEQSRQSAIKAADFILKNLMQPDGRLYRTRPAGKEGIQGFLDDYAFLVRAFISLYQMDFDEKWLFHARDLCMRVISDFSDEKSPLFWYTPTVGGQGPSLLRVKEVTDGVEPSGNAVMAMNLLVLGTYFENEEWLRHSAEMVLNMKSRMLAYPSSHAAWCEVALGMSFGISSLVIVGPQARNYAARLQRKNPRFTFFAVSTGNSSLPVFANRFKEGETLIYLCHGNTCLPPETNPEHVVFRE